MVYNDVISVFTESLIVMGLGIQNGPFCDTGAVQFPDMLQVHLEQLYHSQIIRPFNDVGVIDMHLFDSPPEKALESHSTGHGIGISLDENRKHVIRRHHIEQPLAFFGLGYGFWEWMIHNQMACLFHHNLCPRGMDRPLNILDSMGKWKVNPGGRHIVHRSLCNHLIVQAYKIQRIKSGALPHIDKIYSHPVGFL